MAQLHVYVPDEIACRARQLAEREGVSVSRFLARLLERELGPGWPEGYFELVVGSWRGDRLERAPQGDFETRDSLNREAVSQDRVGDDSD